MPSGRRKAYDPKSWSAAALISLRMAKAHAWMHDDVMAVRRAIDEEIERVEDAIRSTNPELLE